MEAIALRCGSSPPETHLKQALVAELVSASSIASLLGSPPARAAARDWHRCAPVDFYVTKYFALIFSVVTH